MHDACRIKRKLNSTSECLSSEVNNQFNRSINDFKKLVIIMPACNEEKSIRNVIERVPTSFPLSFSIIVLVDDRTKDNTASVAKKAGARIVDLGASRGLAEAFRNGLKEALKENADIIVNIDADGQYLPEDIPRLIAPILAGEADVVLGSRFAGKIEEMPLVKKLGNVFFTWIVRKMTRIMITDAQTGFRAMTRKVAENLEIESDYTYTQEMIIEVAFNRSKIKEVPIFFAKRRHGKSRLINRTFTYALRVTKNIIKCYFKNMLRRRRVRSVQRSVHQRGCNKRYVC